jgi:hypothetical protein
MTVWTLSGRSSISRARSASKRFATQLASPASPVTRAILSVRPESPA